MSFRIRQSGSDPKACVWMPSQHPYQELTISSTNGDINPFEGPNGCTLSQWWISCRRIKGFNPPSVVCPLRCPCARFMPTSPNRWILLRLVSIRHICPTSLFQCYYCLVQGYYLNINNGVIFHSEYWYSRLFEIIFLCFEIIVLVYLHIDILYPDNG